MNDRRPAAKRRPMLSDLQTDYRLRVDRVNLIVRRSLPVYPKQRTSPDRLGWSGWCHSTKSLRSSPLRGGKSRETGRQLRGKRWRV
jgi:hypothetical protein